MSRNECEVYLGNLPPDITTVEIKKMFGRFGKILNIVIKNRGPGPGPPFAFVEFEDPRDVEDAVNKRDGYHYDGYRLRVEFPRGGPGRSSGSGGGSSGGDGRGRGAPSRRSEHRVVVTGLPPRCKWQDLKVHMREAGHVCFADTYMDGTGVVEFLQYEDMKYAVKKLDDSLFTSSYKGETAYIRVKEDFSGSSSNDRRRSRSGSYTPPRGRTHGTPSHSPKRSTSRLSESTFSLTVVRT